MIVRRMVVIGMLLLAVVGCASGGGAGAANEPQVKVEQISKVQKMNLETRTGLPVDYRITIHNPLDQEITLTALEIETVGVSGAYRLKRVRESFDRRIAPKATDAIEIRAWVSTLQETETGEVTGPVSIRGLARFSTPNGPVQSTFSDRVQ